MKDTETEFAVPKSKEREENKGEDSLTDLSNDQDKTLEESKGLSKREARPRAVPQNNSRENDFLFNLVTNQIYDKKYFAELQDRLEFLKFIIKNSDSKIKPVHLKIIWQCLVENSFHEDESSQFFSWCTHILNTQTSHQNTSKEGIVLLDDECIEMLFFDTLLCLDFSSITSVAYDSFQAFFCFING
jgi:hypothetical protein